MRVPVEVLRTYGFSFSQLKELTGTVAENIRRLDQELSQAEQQRQAEEHLQAAAEIARTSGIPLAALIDVLTMFYKEE